MKYARIVIVLFCLVTAYALVMLVFRSSTPATDEAEPVLPIREEPMEGLERVAGVLHVIGEPEPFDGYMIERYADGVMKSRSRIVGGTLHGWVEGWYTNGVKQIEEPFVEGVAHGTRKRWHPNGTLAASTEIQHGELHGSFRRWDEEGNLVEWINMARGKPDGLSHSFYPSGYLRSRVTLKDGEIVSQEHWDDGLMRIEM